MGALGVVVLLVFLIGACDAQEAGNCYTTGGVAGIVVATAVVTAVVIGLVLAALWYLRRRRRGFRTDNVLNGTAPKTTGSGDGKYAYDNPYFRDEESAVDTTDKGGLPTVPADAPQQSATLPNTNGTTKPWMAWTGKAIPFPGVFTQAKRHRTMDDSCLPMEPERIIVPLRGHDFTGLGFNICGNMRDGIFVKDVLNRGPANESGIVKAGDRIASVTVSFSNMVYEDALTILSYASPYDVKLEIVKPSGKKNGFPSVTSSGKLSLASRTSGKSQRLFHPLYRSQSIDDLTQIGKDGVAASTHSAQPKRSQSIGVSTQLMQSSPKIVDVQDDCYGSPKKTRAASSTTGSLNEKVLTNAMQESLQTKSITVPQKVRDQPADSNVTVFDTSAVSATRVQEAHKEQESVIREGTAEAGPGVDEPIITPTRKPISTPAKRKAPAPPVPSNSIETTAQVHHNDDRSLHDGGKQKRAGSNSSSSGSSSEDGRTDAGTKDSIVTASVKALPDEARMERDSPIGLPGESGEEYESMGLASSILDDSLEDTKDDDTSTRRKASSTGDLTTIEDSSKKSPSLLERAVSLDFHNGVLPEGNLNQHKKIMKSEEELFPGSHGLDGSARVKALTEEEVSSDTDSDGGKQVISAGPSSPHVVPFHLESLQSPVTIKSHSITEMTPESGGRHDQQRTVLIRETVVVETKPRPSSSLSSEEVAVVTPELDTPKRVLSPNFSFEIENQSGSLTPKLKPMSSLFSSTLYSSDDEKDDATTAQIITSTPAHRVITVESIVVPKEQNVPTVRENRNSREIIEITKNELDNVMLSHKDFLLKTAQVTGMYGGLSKSDSGEEAEDIKFESWHYTDAEDSGPINGTNGNSTSSFSRYKTAVEGSGTGITVGASSVPQKVLFPEVTGFTTRVSEGPLTTTVVISTTDPSGGPSVQMHSQDTADSPPPELYRPM